MYEDHLGFIWLGTDEGLYRFDGIHFIYYSGKDKKNSLGREVVSCIIEDNKNNLWLGARTGLFRFNRQKQDFDKFSISGEMYIRYVHQENDSCFIVLSDRGILRFYPGSAQWDKIDVGIGDKHLYSVACGDHDDLWIGTDKKLRKYNLKDNSYQDIDLPSLPTVQKEENILVTQLFPDSHRQLWIGTWHKGLLKLDMESNHFEFFNTVATKNNKHILELYNSSMVEDAEGNIWISSNSIGINIYHPSSGTFTYIYKDIDYHHGLTGSEIALASDQEKNIWVKSDRALHYLSKNSPVLELMSDAEPLLDAALFMHFIQPQQVMVGTWFGLFIVNLETKQVLKLNSLIQLPSIHNAAFQTINDELFNDDNSLWITSPQGLRQLHWTAGENGKIEFNYKKLYPTKPSFFPSRLFQVSDSIILVKGKSNTSVLASLNTRSGEYTYHTFPDSISINQIALYKNDTIILAVRTKGLFYYKWADQSMRFIPWEFGDDSVYIDKPVFLKILPLKNGNYALCTENYGLIIYYPEEKRFQQIDVSRLTNTNRVYSVEEDENNNLWIQTSKQLLFYDSQHKILSKINLSNSFKGYNPDFFMNDGKELWCTFEGKLNKVPLQKLILKTNKPRLYLESIKARDHQLNWVDREKIRINYSDNFLSYSFVGLDYENPEGINYWYKIPEISDHWNNLDNRTSISFGRLSPGKYHFIVKAANDAGLWSDEIHAPEIVITPPAWRSWWFILSIIAIIASISAWLINLRKNKRESELRLRNQIARDLHDDIGSTLSGIKIYSGIASGMAENNNDLSSLLDQIRDKSDMMMQSMSDIVWSINPANDSLHDMVIRLKQYMSEMLESQNIDVEYSSQTDLKGYKTDLNHRKELYLTMKEIINNAAKHSACKKLSFSISRQGGEIIFDITDDGIGMDINEITYGNGLKNIQSRMDQIGGRITCESSPDKGTHYCIRMNLT